MLRSLKDAVLSIWMIERFIRLHIRVSRALHRSFGLPGRALSAILDRMLLWLYGIDLHAPSIDAPQLAISHPAGILLGGNGIQASGRVAIMAGVKLVGRHPDDPEYLRRHAERCVFRFGDNVVIGANSVLVGPLDICDNVIIAAMSLVNASITEPGIYVGTPVRKVRDCPDDAWVRHIKS